MLAADAPLNALAQFDWPVDGGVFRVSSVAELPKSADIDAIVARDAEPLFAIDGRMTADAVVQIVDGLGPLVAPLRSRTRVWIALLIATDNGFDATAMSRITNALVALRTAAAHELKLGVGLHTAPDSAKTWAPLFQSITQKSTFKAAVASLDDFIALGYTVRHQPLLAARQRLLALPCHLQTTARWIQKQFGDRVRMCMEIPPN